MQITNTATRYGSVAKGFHWLTALLILTNIALGLLADYLSPETQLALKAQFFTIHKTLGLTILAVATLRILWALTRRRPVHLHPERAAETFLADLVHWMLYVAILAIPLSGWIAHAATEGFAPIWWPFSQNLPGLVENHVVAEVAATAHWLFIWILYVSLALHVAGALKHHVIDRDPTLRRMWFGKTEGGRPDAPHGPGPALVAAAGLWFAAGVALLALTAPGQQEATAQAGAPEAAATRPVTGNWTVEQGQIAFEVDQFGNTLSGVFESWQADISFDPESGTGTVTVDIDVSSLALGSVTEQALGPNYFAVEDHPTATFEAEIAPQDDAHAATGTLSLAGESAPVTLPFTLTIEDGVATMQGQVTLDRETFGIGAGQDPGTLGLEVPVTINLTATGTQ